MYCRQVSLPNFSGIETSSTPSLSRFSISFNRRTFQIIHCFMVRLGSPMSQHNTKCPCSEAHGSFKPNLDGSMDLNSCAICIKEITEQKYIHNCIRKQQKI